MARRALELYEVDESGLDRLDRAVLDVLCRRFGGGPVGISTLAVAVGEERETVEEVAEPFLVRCGFLARTPRGRVATPAAWQHLGLRRPAAVRRRRASVRRTDTDVRHERVTAVTLHRRSTRARVGRPPSCPRSRGSDSCRQLASLLPIVGIALLFWLLIMRPASRRQKELAACRAPLNVG